MRTDSVTCSTGMRVTERRMLSTFDSCVGDRCITTTYAMPDPEGMCSKKVISALRPPADAPMPTTGNDSP